MVYVVNFNQHNIESHKLYTVIHFPSLLREQKRGYEIPSLLRDTYKTVFNEEGKDARTVISYIGNISLMHYFMEYGFVECKSDSIVKFNETFENLELNYIVAKRDKSLIGMKCNGVTKIIELECKGYFDYIGFVPTDFEITDSDIKMYGSFMLYNSESIDKQMINFNTLGICGNILINFLLTLSPDGAKIELHCPEEDISYKERIVEDNLKNAMVKASFFC